MKNVNHLGKPLGESNGRSKLTEKQAKAIRQEFIPYVVTLSDLARKYGVSRGAINDIIQRRTWGWL